MSGSVIFGCYFPAKSLVHNLDPRTKLLCALVLGILIFSSSNYIGLLILSTFIVGVFFLAKIPLTQGFRAIAPLSFIILLTVLFNLFFIKSGQVYVNFGVLSITEGGLHLAVFLGIRLTLLMLTGCLLTLTTTSLDIASALEYILKPFARFGFPSHEFSFVFSLSLSNVAQLAQEFRIVRAAQIARGINLPTSQYKHSPVKIVGLLVPMLASVFRHADTLSSAMDARCYSGGDIRTSLHSLKFTLNDKIAAITMMVLIVSIIGSNLIF